MKHIFIEDKTIHIRIGTADSFLEMVYDYGPGPHYFGRFGIWFN